MGAVAAPVGGETPPLKQVDRIRIPDYRPKLTRCYTRQAMQVYTGREHYFKASPLEVSFIGTWMRSVQS